MYVVRREGESFDQLWRRFKQGAERGGLLRDMKRKRYYLSKGQARRLKTKLAQARLRRRQRRDRTREARGRAGARG
ncbi:MAG TPA: 30S ribosomal protein S21 [Chloroflexota bacterium]